MNKTIVTDKSVLAYIKGLPSEKKIEDAIRILDYLTQLTKKQSRMVDTLASTSMLLTNIENTNGNKDS